MPELCLSSRGLMIIDNTVFSVHFSCKSSILTESFKSRWVLNQLSPHSGTDALTNEVLLKHSGERVLDGIYPGHCLATTWFLTLVVWRRGLLGSRVHVLLG